jgi:hypothetical protein
MDRLLEKYFDESLNFFQEFTVAPVPLHFNKMNESRFDKTFLTEGGFLRKIKATARQATMIRLEKCFNVKEKFEGNRSDLIAKKIFYWSMMFFKLGRLVVGKMSGF